MLGGDEMKFGIGSYTYAWNIGIPGFTSPEQPMDAFGLLRTGIRQGVDVIQYCENLPLTDLSGSALQDLHAEASQHNVSIEVGTRGIDAAEIHKLAELANQFGSGFVRLVIDTEQSKPSPSEIVNLLSPIVQGMGGVRLAIENHDRISVWVLACIVEELGASVCLDTANSLGTMEGVNEVVAALAPYAACLHLKDVKVERAAANLGLNVRGTALGAGQLDILWTLREIGQAENCESVIVELWPEWQGEATLATERAMAEASFRQLTHFGEFRSGWQLA